MVTKVNPRIMDGYLGYIGLDKNISYTVVEADRGKLIRASQTVTITAPSAFAMGVGFEWGVVNVGDDLVTLVWGGNGLLIGKQQLTLNPREFMLFSNTGVLWDSIATNMALPSDNFTGTLTGYAAGPSGTLKYSIVGSRATIYLDGTAIEGTSNANTMTLTGLPSGAQWLSPDRDVIVPCILTDNGGLVIGSAEITVAAPTVATFRMGSPLVTTGFTASGTKGLPADFEFSYLMRKHTVIPATV